MRIAATLLTLAWACVGLAASPDGTLGRRESPEQVRAALARLTRGVPRPAAPGGARRLYVVVTAFTAEHRAALEAAGLTIELPAAPRWRAGVVVQGRATPAARRAIATLPFVLGVEEPGEAWANAGSVATEGDTVLGTAAARDVLSTDGAGAVVGVISDGADDRAASVASGDLPADVALPVATLGSGSGNEGTALLEIVHDVAPGARLLFAPVRTSAEMLIAIDGLAAAGAQVIVDDLVFTDEPKFEDGPIALAARAFTAAGGICVTAAGNFARAHYYGTYRRGAASTLAGFTYPALHAFAGGDFGDGLRVPAGAEVLAVLQWNDAFGRTPDDFDLILARPQGGGDVVLAASTEAQATTGIPLEAVRWQNTSGATVDAYLAVAEFSRVTDPADLRLNIHVFSRVLVPQQYVVARESIFGHAAVEEVLSVAAADVATPDAIEPFSSLGPASIFFPARVVRQVPRLTGVDGVDTAVGRRGHFPNPFHGTSAAAPHIAGCAALLLAAGISPATAASSMLTSAVDVDAAGFDTASGAGRLNCAVAARLATGNSASPIIARAGAAFDGTGALLIDAAGEDTDADTASVVVRLFDAGGNELARETAPVGQDGIHFSVSLVLRRAALARARGAAIQAIDRLGLKSDELTVAITCPGDDSLGDALCALGDLLGRLDASGEPRGRRLSRIARGAAAALVRAGSAAAAERPRRARQALGTAVVRLGRLVRRGRRVADLEAVLAGVQVLRTRVRALRAAL